MLDPIINQQTNSYRQRNNSAQKTEIDPQGDSKEDGQGKSDRKEKKPREQAKGQEIKIRLFILPGFDEENSASMIPKEIKEHYY
jgi:hypothetical protein